MSEGSRDGLQLRSRISAEGELHLSLMRVHTPAPGPDQVVVRIDAAPVNPSDLALLIGPADLSTLAASGSPDQPIVTARVPDTALSGLRERLNQSLPVGNEGAGVVISSGASVAAQALLGRTVAVRTDGAYSQFLCLDVSQCLALPEGTTPVEGASSFINPLTALGMLETMRGEGHTALVHTAAASNLGQMLVRLCDEESVGLVNIVRRPEQAEILRRIGAVHVCDISAPTFTSDLTAALAATGATIAFDAVGGGPLAGQIFAGMEQAANQNAGRYSRYGSSVHKQVYIYGALEAGPTQINRNFGFAWGMGGWLLTLFLEKIGPARAQALRERVAAGVTTTFASQYARQISLVEALRPETVRAYSRRATGEKYLLNPQGG